MSSTELFSEQGQSNLIHTAFNQLTEDLLSYEDILDILQGGLRDTEISRKYEKKWVRELDESA